MKQIVADAAIKDVQNGMIVGLGSGSTAALMIKSLAEEIAKGKLKNIVGVPTSFQSEVLAIELNIPIIALAQLSRSVETRGGDKKPILSDLRESGAIEQDADIVGFLYRPEYYGFATDEDNNSNRGIGEVIIAKHRNGSTGNIKLRFVQEFAKFENLEN